MKALILVGGYGTRLRPLTFTLPKPMVPFANKPIVLHQIEALVRAGVKEVILAVNYQPQVLVDYLKGKEAELGIKITVSKEDEPLGTAGPLALARDILTADDEPFFMFNSDVISEFPLTSMLAFHKKHGGEGSIYVTPVQDPSKYGVVLFDEAGAIQQFIEKPTKFISDKINAGLYLFNPSILKRIEMKPTSIEREIFPKMAADNQLYALTLPGYWMDIGQPKDYLSGTVLHLKSLASDAEDGKPLKEEETLAKGEHITGNVLIHPSATVGANCVLGPDVIIGPDVVIEDGVRLQRTSVLAGCRIKKHAYVSNSIIGWSSTVGTWSRVEESVLGEDVQIKDEVMIVKTTVLPHKGVKASIMKPEGHIVL
jgi:mannose-1-phosphate guanylyltransferase